METVRLTVGHALVRFLDNQYLELDGEETKFVHGVFGIFGHGVVVGLGEAMQVDYAGLARSYGCAAFSAKSAEELSKALDRARKSDRSALIDVKTVKKSMTDGYEAWWRVGIPEVSEKEEVRRAYAEQKEAIKKARAY
jgi:TPP-dependent trihydroxycyclohexane-1,2-dione (THcHDO) dehydratase